MKTHIRWQPHAEEHVQISRPGGPNNGSTQGSSHAAPQRWTDAWGALEHDWLRLATRPEARERLDGWKRMVPELTDFDSPADLLDTIARPGSPERSCSLLAGLLVAARDDAFAAHTVLVALIPGLLSRLVAVGGQHATMVHGQTELKSISMRSAPPGKPSTSTRVNAMSALPASSSEGSNAISGLSTRPTTAI
jgi:hypothetical protein